MEILKSTCRKNCSNVCRHFRCAEENDPTCFCQNFAKSSPNLIIFGKQIAKTIEIC